jgi:hypothetical protein
LSDSKCQLFISLFLKPSCCHGQNLETLMAETRRTAEMRCANVRLKILSTKKDTGKSGGAPCKFFCWLIVRGCFALSLRGFCAEERHWHGLGNGPAATLVDDDKPPTLKVDF